jgi:hypothetical protein
MEERFNDIDVKPVKCSTCKHYQKGFKCKAFDLIPEDIFNETIEHDKVLKGQKSTFIYISSK